MSRRICLGFPWIDHLWIDMLLGQFYCERFCCDLLGICFERGFV